MQDHSTLRLAYNSRLRLGIRSAIYRDSGICLIHAIFYNSTDARTWLTYIDADS